MGRSRVLIREDTRLINSQLREVSLLNSPHLHYIAAVSEIEWAYVIHGKYQPDPGRSQIRSKPDAGWVSVTHN